MFRNRHRSSNRPRIPTPNNDAFNFYLDNQDCEWVWTGSGYYDHPNYSR